MDDKKLNYFKTIGQIQNIISKSDNLENALRDGLKLIIEACKANYAVVWYEENDGDDLIHPYYWICPNDFTGKTHRVNEGVVGKVFSSQKAYRNLTYKKNSEIDQDFKGIKISSFICVPLSSKTSKLGCIEIVKSKGKFSEEDGDICEILALMIGMGIEDNANLQIPYKDRKAIITCNNITREFLNGDVITKVLKGVNLNVYEGEFLVLLGESGCGKSTLLNIISGMDKATSGSFSFLGKDMSDASQNELTKFRRNNIGFIFQSYNLMPNLNAKQNLDLIGELVNDPMSSDEALELVGLSERKNNYPSQLSGGQQQRVSIARSLIKRPKILFADEPTAALDYDTSIQVLQVIEKIARTGTTIVMVTHNEEITKMADRVVRMRNGKMYEVTINRHPCHAEQLVW